MFADAVSLTDAGMRVDHQSWCRALSFAHHTHYSGVTVLIIAGDGKMVVIWQGVRFDDTARA